MNPFSDLDTDDRDDSQGGPRRRSKSDSGETLSVAIVAICTFSLLAAGAAIVGLIWFAGRPTEEKLASHNGKPEAVAKVGGKDEASKAQSKKQPAEPVDEKPVPTEPPPGPQGVAAEQKPPPLPEVPPMFKGDPRTPEERAADKRILDSLSQQEKYNISIAWGVLISKGTEEIPPAFVAILYEHGLGVPLEREAIRFAKSDPDCAEFREITGCKTDRQYVQWGLFMRRKTALNFAKMYRNRPREIPKMLQDFVRDAGGGDWIDRAYRPR